MAFVYKFVVIFLLDFIVKTKEMHICGRQLVNSFKTTCLLAECHMHMAGEDPKHVHLLKEQGLFNTSKFWLFFLEYRVGSARLENGVEPTHFESDAQVVRAEPMELKLSRWVGSSAWTTSFGNLHFQSKIFQRRFLFSRKFWSRSHATLKNAYLWHY